jgi:serine/threonine protein kinase
MHRLHSPHIMKFHDWYETKNNLWLILEYCTCGDLQSLISQDGHLPEASVRMFALDVINGLKVRGHMPHYSDQSYCFLPIVFTYAGLLALRPASLQHPH